MFVSVEKNHGRSSWVKFPATASFSLSSVLRVLSFVCLFVCLFVCFYNFAVSDRSSWQEVFRTKSKLDLINERTHCLQQELNEVVSIPSPPPPPSGPEPSATAHTRPELEPLTLLSTPLWKTGMQWPRWVTVVSYTLGKQNCCPSVSRSFYPEPAACDTLTGKALYWTLKW